jgi:hypothetical protein
MKKSIKSSTPKAKAVKQKNATSMMLKKGGELPTKNKGKK